MRFFDTYPRSKEARECEQPCGKEMVALLRQCYELSRAGCFSRKRSERDKALSDINRITEKYK